MDTRKLPFSEQFSSTMFSSKRKVISGFGLGIIASVFIFTIIFFNPFGISKLNSNFSSFNAPQGNSSLISWFFPVPHATMFSSSSVAEGSKSMEEESGLGKSSKNSSLLNFNGSEGVSVKTHEEGLSDKTNNVGFSEKEERIMEKNNETKLIIKDENGSFLNQSEEIIERTHKENEANFAGAEVLEKTHEEKMLKKDNSSDSEEKDGGLLGKCDIFNGRWVRDEGKPLYPTSSCPHIDRDFNCHKNGRPDHEFLKWRWQPYDCNIPRLNATDFLERLSGKRLVFVGDSLNRNMWESLVCILRHGVANKTRVYEMSGKKEFKIQGHYAFRYEDYNCSVEFVRTPFLVSELIANGGKESGETLRLDLMDQTNIAYRKADVVVFNTGHWWTHEKTSRGKDYYQEGNYVYPMLNVMEAYRKALTTWARWVDKNINANRTQVFFRGYSVTHFRGGQWNSGGQCHKETEPIFNETYLQKYPSKMKTLEDVLKQMRTPVVFMNISKLTDYRKDGHPSIYRMVYKTAKEQIAAEKSQDCSHWCLPGIPDTWNELLYASLVMDSSG